MILTGLTHVVFGEIEFGGHASLSYSSSRQVQYDRLVHFFPQNKLA